MCRPCSEAIESTKIALEEVTGRLKADEYDIHSFPTDLKMSFKILAEMTRMMHLPVNKDIEALSRAVMDIVEPLHKDLCDAEPFIERVRQ